MRFYILIIFLFQFFCVQTMEIYNAIVEDNLELIEDEVNNNGLDINTTLEDGTTLLMFSLLNLSEKITRFLIEKGANLNIPHNGMTPLYFALTCKNIPISTVELMLERQASCFFLTKDHSFFNQKHKKFTIFHTIVMDDIDSEKKKLTINYLFNLYGKDILSLALANSECIEVIEELIANGAYIPSNIIDIAKKLKASKEIIDYFQYQIDLNKKIYEVTNFPKDIVNLIHDYAYSSAQTDGELLAEAILNRNIDFVKCYLKKSKYLKFLIQQNKLVYTILTFAIHQGTEDIANLLIQNGADINAKMEDDKTYLISPLLLAFAKKSFSLDFIKMLLRKGVDIDSVYVEKFKFNKNNYNIAFVLTLEGVTREKYEFLFLYLMGLYGRNVLDFVLDNKDVSIDLIREFIEMGDAVVDRRLIKKAMKLKHSPEVIKFLMNVLYLNEHFQRIDVPMPSEAVNLIAELSIDTQKEIEEKKCIVC